MKDNLPNSATDGQPTPEQPAAPPAPPAPTATSANPAPPAQNPAPDPFNLASLRLGQDFAATVGVRKVLTTVPCRKPNRQEFIRVRPGEDWRLETGLFEDRLNRDIYLVSRSLWPELAGEVFPAVIFTTISRQGSVFLWPCKLPGIDGRSNTWNDSALAGARIAETNWVRIYANMPAQIYDVVQAVDELSEPEWPSGLTFQEILKLCFQDRFIDTPDHPVLRALRGRA
jgi:hypothetical protein